MARVLLLNPSKWGRGITPVWIPGHSAVLKARNHTVQLFDCTFYKNWTDDELTYNTKNQQYLPTDYHKHIAFKTNDIRDDLNDLILDFEPHLIFWSALSSHIHGEGEYVNIQYGDDLLSQVNTSALKIAGGLQPTAKPKLMHERFPSVDYFVQGESEFVLAEIADNLEHQGKLESTKGLVYKRGREIVANTRQDIISDMDEIPPYDYSLFEDQIFLRSYNGSVTRAVDYEMSRGCIYTCSYCVETVIQNYYGFTDTNSRGVLSNALKYVRTKSAERIFFEICHLNDKYGVELFRCHDTNFLTIPRTVLEPLATLLDKSNLSVRLYIETRPEGINASTIQLLKRLKVDGVGMGVESSVQGFRESNLNRFSSQDKIVKGFHLLAESNIKRTAYNIIGLPEEDEHMILETIKFNHRLNPDNITVAFYSPYLGTTQQLKASNIGDFDNYESHVDGQLRTVSKSALVDSETLRFYKSHFVELSRNGLKNLDDLKSQEGIK